jgi:transposase
VAAALFSIVAISDIIFSMFIKLTKQRNGKTTVRIMKSVRTGSKISQKAIRTLGSFDREDELTKVKELAKEIIVKLLNEEHPALPGMVEVVHGQEEKPRKIKKSKKDGSIFSLTNPEEIGRVIHGITGICGSLYNELNFHEIIRETNKDTQWNEILKSTVIARIADPESKRKTVETLELDYNERIPLEKVYRMMDRFHKNIEKAKDLVTKNTLSLFNQEVDILFFDVTTLYFESFTADEIRNFGFSKDCKFKETQVVLALVTNSLGHPITYELFPGNTNEGTTLISVIQSLKKRFTVKKAVLIADRAMFVEKNLKLMDDENIQYVVAAKLKTLPKIKKEEVLGQDFSPTVVSDEFQWLKEFDHKERRLIVSYSSKRAKKDKADRKRLVDRLMKKVKNDQIAVTDLITNHGTKRYVKVEKGSAKINEDKILQDSKWDGLHGVITNIKDKSAKDLLERYRGLWRIEEAFRVNKHNLKMRPIYHWKKSRIEAHIAICFLAYSLSYTLKDKLEQKNLNLSIAKIRDILKRDQYSIIEDTKSKKVYRLPSQNTAQISSIYSALGLKRTSTIIQIL